MTGTLIDYIHVRPVKKPWEAPTLSVTKQQSIKEILEALDDRHEKVGREGFMKLIAGLYRHDPDLGLIIHDLSSYVHVLTNKVERLEKLTHALIEVVDPESEHFLRRKETMQ